MLRRCRWWISHLRFAFAHARAVAWMNAWRERQRMLYGSAAAHLAAFCALGAMRQIDQEYREQHQQVWMLGLGGSSETIPEAEQRWKSILRWREYDEADARIKAEEKRAKEHRVPPPPVPSPGFTAIEMARGLEQIGYALGAPFSTADGTVITPVVLERVFSTTADEAPERHIYGDTAFPSCTSC